MGEKVTVPAELRARLAAANGDAVPLCDDAGNVIGYYLSAAQVAAREEYRAAARLGRPFSDEEITGIAERSRADTRPRRTMADVLRLVECG